MKKYIIYFALITFFVGLGTAQEVFAQKSLRATVNQYIANAAKANDAAPGPKTAERVLTGDLDGDGDKDAVVQYTLEGFGGGNNWTQLMAVFLNQKGVYKFADEATVGGKFFTYSSTLSGVSNGAVVLKTETCAEPPQGICENPAKGTATFSFNNGKLSEK